VISLLSIKLRDTLTEETKNKFNAPIV
jgi:hypothetical protein